MATCKPILVSACLAGVRCRWNGRSATDKRVARLVSEGKALLVCPEQLGGLPTPRSPVRIEAGCGLDVLGGRSRVLSAEGRDFTREVVRGVREVGRLARLVSIRRAMLKEGSPSCGATWISRGGKKIRGQGVLAALLASRGIKVEGVR